MVPTKFINIFTLFLFASTLVDAQEVANIRSRVFYPRQASQYTMTLNADNYSREIQSLVIPSPFPNVNGLSESVAVATLSVDDLTKWRESVYAMRQLTNGLVSSHNVRHVNLNAYVDDPRSGKRVVLPAYDSPEDVGVFWKATEVAGTLFVTGYMMNR